MSERRINLADPEFEPTDEELAGLMQRAFAHVAAQREHTAEQLRREIAAHRDAALARLRASAESAE